jgi:sortase A
MSRRLISTLLVLAGIVILGIVGYGYFRGYQGQEEGRRAWEQARAAAPAAVPTLHVPPPAAEARAESSPTPETGSESENPGIEGAPTPAPAQGELLYPRGQPVGRLKIPAVKMDYVVFGGDDAKTLEKGPGHVPGSELPGEDTHRKNCVITAHRDKHFRRLALVKKGELVDLETPKGTTLHYRVVSREVVKPDAVWVLQPTEKPRLTLITCYPFNWIGAAPKRIVFVAEPVPEKAASAPADRHPS